MLRRSKAVPVACAMVLLGSALTTVCIQAAQAPSASVSPAKWVAPPEAKDVPNPVKTDGRTVERGKKVFETYCVQCHGNSGVGDGPMGLKLGYKVANLTLEKINQQTDGEIFWKISKGRAPMPNWEAQLSPKDRWDAVSYIRTLMRPNQ